MNINFCSEFNYCFSALNLFELNHSIRGNFEKSVTHSARKGTRCEGKQKRTSVINQFLSLEQCYLLLSLFRNFLLKLYWTYLLYTVKVLLIEFLQHIFFDPSKVTSNPNRR